MFRNDMEAYDSMTNGSHHFCAFLVQGVVKIEPEECKPFKTWRQRDGSCPLLSWYLSPFRQLPVKRDDEAYRICEDIEPAQLTLTLRDGDAFLTQRFINRCVHGALYVLIWQRPSSTQTFGVYS